MTRPYAPGYRIPTELLLKAYATGVFPMAESAADPDEVQSKNSMLFMPGPSDTRRARRTARYDCQYMNDASVPTRGGRNPRCEMR